MNGENKFPHFSLWAMLWTILLFFVGWQLSVHVYGWYTSQVFHKLILPAPSQVLIETVQQWDILMPHAIATLSHIVAALAAAIFFAFPLALFMASSREMATVVQTLFLFFKSVPSFCYVPLLILVMGWGGMSAFIPAFLASLFPLTMHLFEAVRSQPRARSEYFLMLGASRWQRFFFLEGPAMVPALFAGLRVALSGAGMATVAGEWCGARSGLGMLLMDMREQLDVTMMFACVFVLSLIGVSLYTLLHLLESFLVPSRRKNIVLLPLLTLLLFSSCQREEQPDRNRTTISLMLDWAPCPTHIPLYHGVKEGFFQEEGIDLVLVRRGALDPLQCLIDRSMVDVVVGHMPRTIRAYCSTGAHFQIIGTLISSPMNGFLARKDRVQCLEDLQGKKLGFCGSHFSSKTFDVLLHQKEVVVAEKINIHADLLSQLAVGTIDAMWGAFEPIECVQLEALGVTPSFFHVEEFGMPSYHEIVFVASATGVFQDQNLIARFQRALQRSMDDARRRKDQAIANYFSLLPQKGSFAKSWEAKSWERLIPYLAAAQEVSYEQVEAFTSWMIVNGIMKESRDLQPLFGPIASLKTNKNVSV